jgi:hypothetical protein
LRSFENFLRSFENFLRSLENFLRSFENYLRSFENYLRSFENYFLSFEILKFLAHFSLKHFTHSALEIKIAPSAAHGHSSTVGWGAGSAVLTV